MGKIVSPVLVITVFARGGQGSVLLARQGGQGPVTDGQDSGERRSEQRTCVVLRTQTHTALVTETWSEASAGWKMLS